jgi:hypothetical protein
VPVISSKRIWTADIHAPRSTAYRRFWTPFAFLPLSGGGGVRNPGRISPTATIIVPGSTVLKDIPDPPCLSTFKPRGGGSGIGHAASQRPRSKHLDQWRSRDPILLSCSVLNQCGPSPLLCHPPKPPFCYCHVSSVLLRSLVQVVLSPYHHPLTTCHVSRSLPRQPPTKCSHYVSSPASSAYFLLPFVSPVTSLTPHHFMPRPHSFGATTLIVRPILCAGLHAYSSGHSANPGGSMKGRPRPQGAELARPSSIPMKQLLKQLVVVRHHLLHNGKVQ